MSRIQKVLALIDPEDYFLISNPTNIRYLSGFTGSNSLILLSNDSQILFTDPRYQIQASKEVSEFEVKVSSDIWKDLLKQISFRTLRIESNDLSVSRLDQILKNHPDLQVTKDSKTIERLRQIKDESELSLIKQACQISTAALHKLISTSVIGLSEKKISIELEKIMQELGATEKAFTSIVASGPNSAIPHHQPTNRSIEKGDFLKIDFGAQLNGYKSDCTRTFVVGNASEWQKEIYESVRSAQLMGRQVANVGVELRAVDIEVRAIMKQSGLDKFFTHGLGHGVGLDIHEDPFLSSTSEGRIAKNMVITIEPGAYLDNRGGVRIEDTGVVTDSGYEIFTEFPYELIELT